MESVEQAVVENASTSASIGVLAKPEVQQMVPRERVASSNLYPVAIHRPDIQLLGLFFVVAIVATALWSHWYQDPASVLPPELRGTTGFSLDINTATAEELSLLPNVGPTLAQRIVEERTLGGPFLGIEDLKRTHGIGDERLKQMEGMLRATHSSAPMHCPGPTMR